MESTMLEMETLENKAAVPGTEALKELEKNLIKSMAGCYQVTFKFGETFAPDPDYKYHDRKFEKATEYVFILEETDNKVSLQHILFIGKDSVIKHWRQDWIYENEEFLFYVKNNEWKKTFLKPEQVKGTWTQKVYQVDDCPRYEGYGTWIHVDGRHFWESTTDAPLPRREITKRQDYNVLRRNSHVEMFKNGSWQLEQDNFKIIRNDNGEDTLLCMEKGLETFTPGDYDETAAAKWWNNNKEFWADVRQEWADFIANNNRIKVQVKVGDDLLFMALFNLGETFAAPNEYDSQKAKAAIRKIFEVHVEGFKA